MYHDAEADPGDAGPVVGRPEVLQARPDLARVWEAADRLFPVRVTRSWWSRMDPSDPMDPLARQALPSREELIADADDQDDPVGEKALTPVPWVVQKHPDRALLLLTKRCHLYCRYCFRRTHDPGEAEEPSAAERDDALRWLAASGVREVILSGGDPLAVRDQVLLDTIDRVRAVPSVRWIRIHTRAPVTRPDRITDGLVAALAARGPVWVVIHANHPRELSPEVDDALARLVDAGVPVLNQAVLLRGVNDDAQVLAALFEGLASRRVKPYYLHHTDAVTGNAAFRVHPSVGLALMEDVRTRISGLAMPRYVVDPPDGSGKTDVATWWAARTSSPGGGAGDTRGA